MNKDYNKILRNYQKRYALLDEQGTPYYFTILFGHQGSNPKKLCEHIKNATGARLFNRLIEEAKNFEADYIIIKEYETNTQDAEVVNGANGEKIFFNPLADQSVQVDNNRLSASRIIESTTQNVDKRMEGFNGFGGLEGYMETQRTLMKNDYEIMVLKNENLRLERENDTLKQNQKSLEDENSELIDRYEEVVKTAEELRKYAPDKWKFLGVNPVPLGAAILERSIKNIARRNPETVMNITGLSKDELAGFIEESTTDTPPQIPQQQSAVIEPSQPLSEAQRAHLQIATAIFEWVKGLKGADLKKVFYVFEYLSDPQEQINTKHTDLLIDFINQNPKDKKDE